MLKKSNGQPAKHRRRATGLSVFAMAMFFPGGVALGQTVTPAPGQPAGQIQAPSPTIDSPNVQPSDPRSPTQRGATGPDTTPRAPTPPEAVAPEIVFPPVENTVPGSEGNIVLPPAENLGDPQRRGETVLPPPESTLPPTPQLNDQLPGQFQDGVLDTPPGVLDPQPQDPGLELPADRRFQGGYPTPLNQLETTSPGSRPGAPGAITAPIEPYDPDEWDALDFSVSP